MLKADVAIIGAGVVGLFTAYMLTRSGYSTIVIERERRPGLGVTSRSANVIHVLQPPFNSLKSRLCIEGNILYHELQDGLGFKVLWTRLILAYRRAWQKPIAVLASKILRRVLPERFNVDHLPGARLRDMEPQISDNIKGGVVVSGYGVIDTMDLINKLYSRVSRDSEVLLDTTVTGVTRGGTPTLKTSTVDVKTRLIVNAGGLNSDEIAGILGDPGYKIIPIKGVMTIHDGPKLRNIIAPLELGRKETKGGGAIPQPSGETLLGPNNAGPAGKNDYTYTSKDLKTLTSRFQNLLNTELPEPRRVIVGLRPTVRERDFIIKRGRHRDTIHLIGIESPGLTAAPAIAKRVTEMIQNSPQHP